eukprot:408216-Rhodomonas_salina.5
MQVRGVGGVDSRAEGCQLGKQTAARLTSAPPSGSVSRVSSLENPPTLTRSLCARARTRRSAEGPPHSGSVSPVMVSTGSPMSTGSPIARSSHGLRSPQATLVIQVHLDLHDVVV